MWKWKYNTQMRWLNTRSLLDECWLYFFPRIMWWKQIVSNICFSESYQWRRQFIHRICCFWDRVVVWDSESDTDNTVWVYFMRCALSSVSNSKLTEVYAPYNSFKFASYWCWCFCGWHFFLLDFRLTNRLIAVLFDSNWIICGSISHNSQTEMICAISMIRS